MTPRQFKIRVAVIAALALAPVVFFAGVGSYHLWMTGWSWIAFWPMAGCYLAAYLLGWYWLRRRRVTAPTDAEPRPEYWTDTDKRAWVVVEEYVTTLTPPTADQFSDLNRYASEAQELALRVARVYRPSAADPFGHLALPEILACGELVSHDLAKLVERYVPGSHLMSVNDYKRVRTAVDAASEWYPRLRGVYWLATAFINPIKTGLQVAATKGGLMPAFQGFQQNILLWFHVAYVRQLGRYLIELNSGRLKVGAKRYLELMEQHLTPPTEAPPVDIADPAPPAAAGPAAPAPEPPPPVVLPSVTVAVVGPVKAGKSTLVNALLGEQKAGTDVLPLTAGATKYVLRQPGRPTLTVTDSAGFGQDGATEADVKAAVEVARGADLVLLAVPARSAARRPESDFLDRVRAALAATPHLKMPDVALVLTQIDVLSPAAEWAPPYDWRAGGRPKERSIRAASEAAREVFGDRVADVVPVCAVPGKEVGVQDDLLPRIAARLGEARGVAFLRALHAEAAIDKTRRVVNQVLNAGGAALKAWWDSAKK